MKRCPKCDMTREFAEFGKDKSRKDGLQVWCKPCQRDYRKTNRKKQVEYSRQWKKDNPEKVKAARDKRRAKPEVQVQRAEYNRQWKKDNPEKVKAQAKRSYGRHAEDRREKARQYAKDNPEKVTAASKRWRDENQVHIKKYRKKNRHLDRAYYAQNADEIRSRKEARRQWSVYRIEFDDGCFYLGSSCHADLRFNAHKSLADRGVHIQALNDKDFATAKWEVLSEHPSEESALEAEAQAIQEAWGEGTGCLNKVLPKLPKSLYWVYVIQSLQVRTGKRGNPLPGFFYVGMTTDPTRRLREHNGLYANGKPGNPNGGKYTAKHRPWEARALHGPYFSRSEALRAEYKLKRSKRGKARLTWSPEDSDLCRGEGVGHPWVVDPQGWKPPTPQEWRDGLSC